FRKSGRPYPLVVVCDGQDVIDYLSGQPPYADRVTHPLPALLLLDLKMPRVSGFDVLEWLAARPHFKQMPVIVLSSSSHESDIERVQQLGPKDYIIKPHHLTDFVTRIQGLLNQWLTA